MKVHKNITIIHKSSPSVNILWLKSSMFVRNFNLLAVWVLAAPIHCRGYLWTGYVMIHFSTRYNCCDVSLCRSPLAQMEEERREHVMKMKKMEIEMEQVFEMKVKEKKQKLKDSEAEVCVCEDVCVWFDLMSIFFPIALYICHWLMSQKSLAIFDAAGAASRTDEEESRSSV